MVAGFERRIAVGVAWMTMARAAVRALGLLSTIVLARLLAPTDFGLVAMAMVVATGLELLTLFGFDAALVHRREISRAHYDSAWTLNLLLGVSLALVLVAIAIPVADFYGEPRLQAIIYVISAKYVIASAVNPGTVDFRRNIDFRPEFVMHVGPKVVGLLVTIPVAIWLRNYRALLAGMVVTSVATLVLSYLMHPHRPRWCLIEAGTLYRFSRWLLLNNVLNYLRNRSADLIIGRTLGPASLGAYSISYEVSNLPSTEMVAPINRVLFPGYAQMAGDLDRLRGAFRATLGLIALLILPASVGIAAVADPLVRVMLGEKWLGTIPIISLLALAGASTVLQTNASSLQYALGQPRMVTFTGTIQVALLLPLLLWATLRFGLEGAAWAVLVHGVALALPITYLIVRQTTPVRIADFVAACWRPVIASALMYGTVRVFLGALNTRPSFTESLTALLVACLLGALTYAAAVLLLWLFVGRPRGSELWLIERIKPFWNRLSHAGRRPL